MTIRKEVAVFAAVMEQKLSENDHKRHWSHCSRQYLFTRLHQETKELSRAVRCGEGALAVLREAADVANIAMMIADNETRDHEDEEAR